MTTMTRTDQTDTDEAAPSPMLRSAAAIGRSVGARFGENSDAVFIVLATVAFVVVVGLLGFVML
jgi:hypothetical protein